MSVYNHVMGKKLGWILVVLVLGLAWVVYPRVERLQAQESIKLGDVDKDGDVDVTDYGLILRYFETEEPSADFNLNGMVDIYDVNQVVTGMLIALSPDSTSEFAVRQGGIWISKEEIMALPMSGEAWEVMYEDAQQNTNNPDFSDQDSNNDTYTLAKALVYARTGEAKYGQEVRHTLEQLVITHPIGNASAWDWLGIIQGLGGYVIAADVMDLAGYDASFDSQVFRPWLMQVRSAVVGEGKGSVVLAQEVMPNSFGTQAAASRIAADLYLGDEVDLARAIEVFQGHLGDRSKYSDQSNPGFKYGELSWQCDEGNPVGINPEGCEKDGVSLDGVMADDQQKCGEFEGSSLCKSGDVWGGLQGVVAAAEMLHRAGYPVYEWSDRAVLRAVSWLHDTIFEGGSEYVAGGDNAWTVWIINKRYGSSFATTSPLQEGRMVGYSDWTHQ